MASGRIFHFIKMRPDVVPCNILRFFYYSLANLFGSNMN